MTSRRTTVFSALGLSGALSLAGISGAAALHPIDGGGQDAAAPVFVELFTSQSCSSCPPAEAYMTDLAARPDLVTIEWHVDYWNDLTLARAGNWKDPFSTAANTERQRSYNARIRGRNGVYTPQTVINGKYETVGSQRREIDALIRVEKSASPADLGLSVEKRGQSLSIQTTAPSDARLALYLVPFVETVETKVRGGENKGLVLREAHVATGLSKLADINAGELYTGTVNFPVDSDNCAILVQEPKSGDVISARYCE